MVFCLKGDIVAEAFEFSLDNICIRTLVAKEDKTVRSFE